MHTNVCTYTRACLYKYNIIHAYFTYKKREKKIVAQCVTKRRIIEHHNQYYEILVGHCYFLFLNASNIHNVFMSKYNIEQNSSVIRVRVRSFTVLAIVRGASIERHPLLTVLRISEAKIQHLFESDTVSCRNDDAPYVPYLFYVPPCSDVGKCVHTRDNTTTHMTFRRTQYLHSIQFTTSTSTTYICVNQLKIHLSQKSPFFETYPRILMNIMLRLKIKKKKITK